MYEVLDSLKNQQDLKKLDKKHIGILCSDIREFLINNVSKTGGHLASNLGAVELTVALHRVFDLEEDRIIFDVGHQSYTHKILTGRKDSFDTLRKVGGLSGFTSRDESKYDPFGAGHSSTSLSAALGFAEADAINGRGSFTVAVVGDGAFTGGMIHEALNNCRKGLNLIIVLNENEMSISKNTGLFARAIAKMRVSKNYVKTKRTTATFLKKIPIIGTLLVKIFKKIKNMIKNALVHTNYFEEMGLTYFGPADGHDTEGIELLLKEAKQTGRVSVVHVKTVKGKGYAPAENDPKCYHSYYPDKAEGETFNAKFGQTLCAMAESDDKICAVTAAMGFGTGLETFKENYPKRFFDVGIAEEHALTFCAGLACAGEKPYFAVYSTFLQRGYDNVIHDIALQNLPVHICIDRAGIAPSDGPTHHGIFDVPFLLSVPNVSLYAPATLGSLARILYDTKDACGPVAIRYPNTPESKELIKHFYKDGDFGKYGVISDYDVADFDGAVTVITYGNRCRDVLAAAERARKNGKEVQVILLEVLKPYDEIAKKIAKLLPKSGKIIFVEESIRTGGAGMVIGEKLQKYLLGNYKYEIRAIDDNFAHPDSAVNVYAYEGIDEDSVYSAIMEE